MRSKTNLSLEEYLSFTENPQSSWDDLSNHKLNQIIALHGYIKSVNWAKIDIVQRLSGIKLVSPARHTTSENVSLHAFSSVREAKQDLVAIAWQECEVWSVQTLTPVANDEKPLGVSEGDGTINAPPVSRQSHNHPPGKRRKRKIKMRAAKSDSSVIDGPELRTLKQANKRKDESGRRFRIRTSELFGASAEEERKKRTGERRCRP